MKRSINANHKLDKITRCTVTQSLSKGVRWLAHTLPFDSAQGRQAQHDLHTQYLHLPLIRTIKIILVLSILFCSQNNSIAQITSGKIVYERKTNLYKKFKFDDAEDWIDKEDKNKIDIFELYFNDTISVFQPQESELREEMSWATSKNKVFQNFNNNYRLTIKEIWGEKLYVEDTVIKRRWKITESKRNISGYNCRKAIWQANDSTRIYAWYCDEIIPNIGPESFCGLPGAILGIATEDGGVIYFAKSIELIEPDMAALIPKKGKNKIYATAELKAKLTKDYGKNKWGKAMIKNLFGIW